MLPGISAGINEHFNAGYVRNGDGKLVSLSNDTTWHLGGNGPIHTRFFQNPEIDKLPKTMTNKTTIPLAICLLLLMKFAVAQTNRWPAEKAKQWYAKQGWLRGSNFQPSTAINQLEMFQPETFDTATINRELGWAAELGFNVMRVYLHHLLWTADAAGFKKRLNTYLTISARHGIK
jgi:hypothetical protein